MGGPNVVCRIYEKVMSPCQIEYIVISLVIKFQSPM